MAGWKAWKHTAVHQPRWLLHAWWGVDHTPVDTTELKTQTAQRGWGTDGWKPTTAKAADTFTAQDTGRIGQEHQGQGIGNKQEHQAHQATGLPRVHAHLQGDRGGDFISATTQPTPHKSTKVVAQQQQFKTGRVLKHALRIRWQRWAVCDNTSKQSCMQREPINTSAAWDLGKAHR